MTHKKQTVYLETPTQEDGLIRVDGCTIKNGGVDKLLEKVEGYFLTPEDLLALRKKWAAEAVGLLKEFFNEVVPHINGHKTAISKFMSAINILDDITPRKETYLNNLTIE